MFKFLQIIFSKHSYICYLLNMFYIITKIFSNFLKSFLDFS